MAVTASNVSGTASVQSASSAAVTPNSSPFAINSTIADGQNLSGKVQWKVTPSAAINFAQFYIDGVLSQTVSSSPYEYNQSTTGLLDTGALTNGNHVLGIEPYQLTIERMDSMGPPLRLEGVRLKTQHCQSFRAQPYKGRHLELQRILDKQSNNVQFPVESLR